MNSMINQTTLVGRLTKDPQLKNTSDGTAYSQITLAVNRNFRNQAGDFHTDFVTLTLWRKNAENTVIYCRKGSVIGVVGRVQTRSYDNHQQQRVYTTEIIAESVKFLSGKAQETSSSQEQAFL